MTTPREQRLEQRLEELRTKIAAIAAKATEAERRKVDQIISQARVGDYQAEKETLTPAIAAILFLEVNPHNRDWRPEWTEELVRRLNTGQWQNNGDTIRFYQDGAMADGQNRCAAIALSGQTVDVILVYGLKREAITTIDDGKPRYASDAAKLDGINNAKRKESIIKWTASYLVRAGQKDAQLRSETEIKAAIVANNVLLDSAIELGIESRENIVTPILKEPQAQLAAYLMLVGKWPVQLIREQLTLFQTGKSTEGENSPYFVAGQMIERSRISSSKRAKLSATKETGIVIFAMLEAQKGTKALGSQKFRDAVRKEVPRPDYPGDSTI
jgi:hypothetical protein